MRLDWMNSETRTNCRRDQTGGASEGGPGWIPLGGSSLPAPSGRPPPGSRKTCHYRYGPPPFSGQKKVSGCQADTSTRPDCVLGRSRAEHASLPASLSVVVG